VEWDTEVSEEDSWVEERVGHRVEGAFQQQGREELVGLETCSLDSLEFAMYWCWSLGSRHRGSVHSQGLLQVM
jgi:hypothetical protein